MQQKRAITYNMFASNFDLPTASNPAYSTISVTPSTVNIPGISQTPQPDTSGGGVSIDDIKQLAGDVLAGIALFKGGGSNTQYGSNPNYPIPPAGYYYNSVGQLMPYPTNTQKTNWIILAVFAVLIIIVILVIARRKK